MESNDSIVPGFDIEWDKSLRITLGKVDQVPRCVCIYLKGSIDNYNSNFFQNKITSVIGAGYINLIFNCQALEYVSSTGIGNFTSLLNTLKPRGGSIVFLQLQPKVMEIFQLLGFNHFFNLKDTLNEAVDFFKQAQPSASSVFPKSFPCPMCQQRLKASHAGRFRCSECKTIISVLEDGQVVFG
ncbi:MAG: STAS domain-containing protein [Treponema sp.]|nr:STAS domain-containing protein [Treponema sp.]